MISFSVQILRMLVPLVIHWDEDDQLTVLASSLGPTLPVWFQCSGGTICKDGWQTTNLIFPIFHSKVVATTKETPNLNMYSSIFEHKCHQRVCLAQTDPLGYSMTIFPISETVWFPEQPKNFAPPNFVSRTKMKENVTWSEQMRGIQQFLPFFLIAQPLAAGSIFQKGFEAASPPGSQSVICLPTVQSTDAHFCYSITRSPVLRYICEWPYWNCQGRSFTKWQLQFFFVSVHFRSQRAKHRWKPWVKLKNNRETPQNNCKKPVSW